MHMIAGIRGAVTGFMVEVVEDHIRTHLVDPQKNPGALNADAADQLIEVVHSYHTHSQIQGWLRDLGLALGF